MLPTTTNGLPTNQRVGSSSGGPTPPPRPVANGHDIYRQRLDKYIWAWNHRPQDNNIAFWRLFVSEFFACGCKKKLCLRAYKDNPAKPLRKIRRFLDEKSLCFFHCRAYSNYGYEISFEEMPLYFQNKFASLNDERLHLGIPQHHKLSNGATLLYFPEALEEASREYARTIRKGHLAVVFSPLMKIISWQFCMHHSEQFVSLHPQLRDFLQNASASMQGQPCSQDVEEACKKILRNVCDMTNQWNQHQFDELGLSDNDRTFMASKSSNYMKDKMDSGIQGNMGLKETSSHNSNGPASANLTGVQNNGPAAANLSVQNNNPSAGNDFQINNNHLFSGNLTIAYKNFCTRMMSPDLGNRNVTQQVNMQLPPHFNPINQQGPSSTNRWPVTENTLSAGRNGVPSHTTDDLAGAHKFNLITQLENSKPIPSSLKRPFPENNASSNPQQGRAMRQKQGESTGNGKVGYVNQKAGTVSDLIELNPSLPVTGPSPILERRKDDSNNKGKGIMQEVENRHNWVERNTRPDLTMQMPSHGMRGTESFPKNNSGVNPQQGSTTRQRQGEASGNGRVGNESHKVNVSNLIELKHSQPITGPSPILERGKDDSNNKGKGIMQEVESRHIWVERNTRPDLTMQMPSHGMRSTESFPKNNSGVNPQQGCTTQQKQGEETGNCEVGNESHRVGVSNLTELTRSQPTTGSLPSLEQGKDDCNKKGKGVMQEAENRHISVERNVRPDSTMQMPSNGIQGTKFFPENNSGMNPQQGCTTKQKQGEATGNCRVGNESHKVGVSNLTELTRSQPTTGPLPSLERGKDDSNNKGKGIIQEAENRHSLVERDVRPDSTIHTPSNGLRGTESDSSSVGLNTTTVDGNQSTEEFLVDIDIDSIMADFDFDFDFLVSDDIVDSLPNQ